MRTSTKYIIIISLCTRHNSNLKCAPPRPRSRNAERAGPELITVFVRRGISRARDHPLRPRRRVFRFGFLPPRQRVLSSFQKTEVWTTLWYCDVVRGFGLVAQRCVQKPILQKNSQRGTAVRSGKTPYGGPTVETLLRVCADHRCGGVDARHNPQRSSTPAADGSAGSPAPGTINIDTREPPPQSTIAI